MKESGDPGLYDAVREGDESLSAAARRVRNAAVAITAYAKCSEFEKGMVQVTTGLRADLASMLRFATPDQLMEAVNLLGTDWIWENLIVPAVPTKPDTKPTSGMKETVITESAITDVA